jgi:hypothetical protein
VNLPNAWCSNKDMCLVILILIEPQPFPLIIYRWLAAYAMTRALYVPPSSYLARNLANVHKLIVSKITRISLSLKPVKASVVVLA